jgi:hypothetical protein
MLHHASLPRFRTISLLVALLCLVTATACQAQPPGKPQATALQQQTGADRFNSLKNTTIKATDKIATTRARDMYEEIVAAMAKFNELSNKVKSATAIDAIIGDIAASISDIADSYSRLASLGNEVDQAFSSELVTLRTTYRTSGNVVEQIDAAIANKQKIIADLETRLWPFFSKRDTRENSSR